MGVGPAVVTRLKKRKIFVFEQRVTSALTSHGNSNKNNAKYLLSQTRLILSSSTVEPSSSTPRLPSHLDSQPNSTTLLIRTKSDPKMKSSRDQLSAMLTLLLRPSLSSLRRPTFTSHRTRSLTIRHQ